MFELELNSFRKTVKDFDCLTSGGKLFHTTAPLYIAEAISVVIGS